MIFSRYLYALAPPLCASLPHLLLHHMYGNQRMLQQTQHLNCWTWRHGNPKVLKSNREQRARDQSRLCWEKSTVVQVQIASACAEFFSNNLFSSCLGHLQGVSVFLLTTNMRLFLNPIINDIFSPILICEKPCTPAFQAFRYSRVPVVYIQIL